MKDYATLFLTVILAGIVLMVLGLVLASAPAHGPMMAGLLPDLSRVTRLVSF